MTNEEILRIAMEQSAVDANCLAEDFVKTENKIVYSKERPDARRYLELPLACHLVSYGTNIVASVGKEYEGLVRHYIEKYPVEHCFETPNLYVLNDAFAKYDLRVCFMAEYFLPDVRVLRKEYCSYKIRILENQDFQNLYTSEWPNIKSARNAIRSGFRPAWVELTVKPTAFVEKMNL